MESQYFDVETIALAGREEHCVRGGRHLFPILPRALAGVRRIGVIGWGSQARAQALNLRDSLTHSNIGVTVGLRAGSSSWDSARSAGFDPADGTLGEMFDVIDAADLVLLLVSDAAQVELHDRLTAAIRPEATLGLSHGFLPAFLRSTGREVGGAFSVVAVCPKGMGPSVRRLYEQGASIDGAGINASIAVHRDHDGCATDRALAWAIGIGAPVTFETDLLEEATSDITGERAILLGGPHAVAEALYRWYRDLGEEPASAFVRSTESMTGPLARTISGGGIRAVLEAVANERGAFDAAYCRAYRAFVPLLEELYGDVRSGDELAGVLRATARLDRHPMAVLEGTGMWLVGEEVRSADRSTTQIDPVTAGIFIGLLMAQVDLLVARGHRWSEIANESVIEIVDSLIPFMHARGVAHMIDNCSVTARLGARKWGPRFQATIEREILPGIAEAVDPRLIEGLTDHELHDVLETMATFRPPVDIAVA